MNVNRTFYACSIGSHQLGFTTRRYATILWYPIEVEAIDDV
jgi:hypothetical protein